MSVNKVILVGNAGKDPETRHLEGGMVVSRFSLATSEVYRNRNGEKVTNTEWHNIVLWRGLAEVAEKYVRKGSQLYIEGRIRNRSYTDKEGNTRYTVEIVADSMQMLGKRTDNQETPGSAPVPPTEAKPQSSGNTSNTQNSDVFTDNQNNSGNADDDLPF